MVATRETFTAQAAPELLATMRWIAHKKGCEFEPLLEEALREYVEAHAQQEVRPEVIAHFLDSLEKNRRLGELLAAS